MKIREKLTTGYLIMSVIVVVLCLLMFKEIKEIQGRFAYVAYEAYPLVETIEELQFYATRIADSAYEYAIVVAENQHIQSKQYNPYESMHRLNVESKKNFLNRLADFRELTSKYKLEYTSFIRKVEKIGENLIRRTDELIELKKEGKTGQQVIELERKINQYERELHKTIEELLLLEDKETRHLMELVHRDMLEALLAKAKKEILGKAWVEQNGGPNISNYPTQTSNHAFVQGLLGNLGRDYAQYSRKKSS